ncbi:MAG: phytoene desaturase [Caulobacteraceae bacterium]|nr:phytoene desaturase [Caulobacter sp.]
MPDHHVAIIGAGIGGLAAAIEAAAAGARVTVVEAADGPGGKLRQVAVGGIGIDAGPTVLTLAGVFEALFARAGLRLADVLTLVPQPILARHWWTDGTILDLHADPERTAAAIEAFAGPAEARGFEAFRRHTARTYATLAEPFLEGPRPANPLALMVRGGWSRLPGFLRIQPYTRFWDALDGFFADPRLKQLFGRYATYCGSSPFAAPATLMLVAHVEQQGVWAVAGGMGRLAAALAEAATRLGVRFRYGTAVTGIATAQGRVTGLRTADGFIAADAVVANCDAAALAAGLLGPEVTGATAPMPVATRSFSAVTVAGLGAAVGCGLLRHNVFFSGDSPAEFATLAAGRMPDEPTVYLCAQARGASASELAPGAPEPFLLIANAPALGDARPFTPSETLACEERIFRHLARCGLTLTRQPGATQVSTPADFSARYPGTGGALYGRASHGWMASFRRPGSRTRIPGLYLAGGSAHPGAGVPMAALSGRLAAKALVADLASTRRFRPGATIGGTSMRSATTAGKG